MKKIIVFAFFAYMASVAQAQEDKNSYQSKNKYQTSAIKPVDGKKVKNIILMIADGMSLTHLYTAWVANQGQLNIENCTYTGLVKTYCANKLITDSGAAGTAMATGQKTNYHSVGVDTNGNPLTSLTDLAHAKKMSTAIVVTCGLEDATPASFCANNRERDEAEAIALDYLSCDVDFVFGGGRDHFNKRSDNRDLLSELSKKGYQTCTSLDEVKKIQKGKVFAVVNTGQLPLAPERGDALTQASMKAISLLSQNKQGFFAMIEGSRIDDAGHWNDTPKLVEEIFDFDRTVGSILSWAEKNGETLVIVVSDHQTGGLTLLDGNLETGEVKTNYSTGGHSGVMVPIYTYGPGANQFTGFMENTDIFDRIKGLMD